MKITKMHGLGNDFILTEEYAEDYADAAKRLCARRLNVGADGLVVIAAASDADLRMRIFNADGSEAEMCGNAIRCFARYVYDRGIVRKKAMRVETLAGIVKPELIIENDEVTGVRVDMGVPDFTPEAIPVLTDTPLDFEVSVSGGKYRMSAVLMGVPHAVVFCDDLDNIDIDAVGAQIECHPLFPRRVNVNFAQVLGKTTIRVRTFERGAGRTLACGTGSTGTVAVAYKKGLTEASADVLLEAGELRIEITEDGRAFMTGPAAYVFTGETM